MTYCTRELEEMKVNEFMRSWRKWRRSMFLSIEEAATCAGVSVNYLQQLETGIKGGVGPTTKLKLAALMARWNESQRPKKKHDGRGRWARDARGRWQRGKRVQA